MFWGKPARFSLAGSEFSLQGIFQSCEFHQFHWVNLAVWAVCKMNLCRIYYPLVMTNIAMEAMAHRNRWFTVLNSMVIFHGYVKQPDGKSQRKADEFTVLNSMVIFHGYVKQPDGKSQRKADENREGASNHGFMKRQNTGKLWKMAEKNSGWPPCLNPLHIQHNYPWNIPIYIQIPVCLMVKSPLLMVK